GGGGGGGGRGGGAAGGGGRPRRRGAAGDHGGGVARCWRRGRDRTRRSASRHRCVRHWSMFMVSRARSASIRVIQVEFGRGGSAICTPCPAIRRNRLVGFDVRRRPDHRSGADHGGANRTWECSSPVEHQPPSDAHDSDQEG